MWAVAQLADERHAYALLAVVAILPPKSIVKHTVATVQIDKLNALLVGPQPIPVGAHAYEQKSVNAIPEVFADALEPRLGWEVHRA